jgi:hypothetical protein
MNRRYSALALFALAMGAVALTATEASAIGSEHPSGWWVGYPGTEAKSSACNHPTCDPRVATVMPQDPKPPNYPNYDPRYEVPPVQVATADNGVDVLQAGASAVGGAALAFGAMWLHRRHQAPTT